MEDIDNKIITFGKYKNYKYIEIYEKDKKYCEWISNLKVHNNNKYILTFKEYIISKNKIECIICCCNIVNEYKKLICCNNIICDLCLIKILNFICPFCRKDFEMSIDKYTKEIKKYIIEKEENIKKQEYLKNTYLNKYLKLEYKNKEMVKKLKELISIKNLDKKIIIDVIEEYIPTD